MWGERERAHPQCRSPLSLSPINELSEHPAGPAADPPVILSVLPLPLPPSLHSSIHQSELEWKGGQEKKRRRGGGEERETRPG